MSSLRRPVLGPLSPREFLAAADCPRRWALERERCGREGLEHSSSISHEELQRLLACDAAERVGRVRDLEVGDERLRGVLDFVVLGETQGEASQTAQLLVCRGSLRLKDKLREEVRVLALCARISGLLLSSAEVLLINKQYRAEFPDKHDHEQLFTSLELSLPSSDELDLLEHELEQVYRLLSGLQGQEVAAYPACSRTSCVCRRHGLPDHHVYTLFLASGTADRLLQQGIESIKDIPENTQLGRRQRIQRQALIHNQPFVDHDRIHACLERLRYPVGYLDFEAIASPVPLYSGTTPWQYVPFLFSLHIEISPGVALEHRSYFCRPQDDARAALASELDAALTGLNTVVVFDASLEKRIMRSLAAEGLIGERNAGSAFSERLLDLYPLFREFAWYSPEQRGSVSLKAILPLMTQQVGYKGMEVSNGLSAGTSYLAARRAALRGLASESDSEHLARYIGEYCKVDTLGLYYIVQYLSSVVRDYSKPCSSLSVRLGASHTSLGP